MFPTTAKRYVVLDAASVTGYTAVEALASSPHMPRDATVVAVPRAGRGPDEDEPVLRMLQDLAEDPELRKVTVARPGKVHVHPESDVVVYATREFESSVITDSIPTAKGRAQPPLVLLTSDDAHIAAMGTLSSLLASWRVVQVRTVSLAPATTARLRNGRCLPQLASPLENFALGVALGVTRFFGVNASQPADIVPIDVALHAGIGALALCYSGSFPTHPKNPNHIVLTVVANSEQALCWGMVAEYILDYYGRFGTEIARKIPGDAFNADPTLAFNAHFPDLWNYGLSLTTPLEVYRQRHARLTKSYLKRYPHSTTAERMKTALDGIDASLTQALKQTAAKRVQMDNNTYRMLLRRLALDRAAAPAYRASNIHSVQWEQYVKRIAVHVLHFLAGGLLNHHEPMHLPAPVPVWTNDVEFQGETRAPVPNLPLRRVFDDVHMVLRGGQQPNGQPIALVPGGTTRNFLGILAQPHVQQLIRNIADEQYLAKEDVEARAVKILRQIGDNVNHRQARTLAYVMRKVFKTVYTRVSLNDGAYETLFKAFNTPRTAVILMPSHRSYMDFIILSYLMLVMGFPLPHICAGEDFLRLGGVADMLRGAGAFFMRRTFRGDKLYAALFKEYVRHLVRRGECVEFFIEGTRSRTQKTLGPKLGFLKIITDAFLEPQKEINDVLLLPISLSYEKILEGNLYADELLGIPKPKETPMNLLRAATILRKKFGSFNVNVGQPISLAEFAADPHQVPAGFQRREAAPSQPAAAPSALARAASLVTGAVATAPKPPASPPAAGKGFTPDIVLQRVGWRLTYELERHLVVTPTAIVSAVVLHMFDHTALKDEGVPMAAVASRVEWLRSKVLGVGGLMNHEYAAFDGQSLLACAVEHLAPHVTISPISSRVMLSRESVASYMVLAMYTNQLVHLFGREGTVCVAAAALSVDVPTAVPAVAGPKSVGDADAPAEAQQDRLSTTSSPLEEDHATTVRYAVPRAALAQRTEEVRSLLWHELPDFQSASPVCPRAAFDATLKRLQQERAVVDGEAVACAPNYFFSFTAQLVYPNIEGYFALHCALGVLRAAGRVPEPVLLNLTHKLALRLYDMKLLQYIQCSNKETLKNALTRALEANTAISVKGARASTVALHPTAAANDAAGLLGRIRELNALRNRPCAPADLDRCLQTAAELYASMTKLPAKL